MSQLNCSKWWQIWKKGMFLCVRFKNAGRIVCWWVFSRWLICCRLISWRWKLSAQRWEIPIASAKRWSMKMKINTTGRRSQVAKKAMIRLTLSYLPNLTTNVSSSSQNDVTINFTLELSTCIRKPQEKARSLIRRRIQLKTCGGKHIWKNARRSINVKLFRVSLKETLF